MQFSKQFLVEASQSVSNSFTKQLTESLQIDDKAARALCKLVAVIKLKLKYYLIKQYLPTRSKLLRKEVYHATFWDDIRVYCLPCRFWFDPAKREKITSLNFSPPVCIGEEGSGIKPLLQEPLLDFLQY